MATKPTAESTGSYFASLSNAELHRALNHEATNLRAFWADDSGTSLHLHAADLMDEAARRLTNPGDI